VTVDEQSIPPSRGVPDRGTLRIVSSSDAPSLDPATGYDGLAYPILYATCAQLLNYPDKAGPAGSQLIPEVAQSLPARSADGRTYRFKIRPGFRFSSPSNEPVTAQTFKDTIERTLNPRTHAYYARFLADIVGAVAYMSGKASHIAGVVANGDALTIRLLAPAPDFLARISQPPASCAVPSDTPINRNGVNVPIPSAGPYYVTSYTRRQGVVLMRNPNYHGRRPHHFARIELTVGISPKRAVSEIEAGVADYTPVGLEASAAAAMAAHLSQLADQYGARSAAAARGAQQYFANPSSQLDYFVLNTQRPLFRDVRMRQAVNYAINRRALAQLGDGFDPLPTKPTDHYLPPGIPGFRNSHFYPMTPNVAKARELAHGGGGTAVLYTCDSSACPEQAHIVATDLAAIGLRVQIKTIPFARYYTVVSTRGAPFDLAWDGWIWDYFDPAAMLTSILQDSSIGPTFDDPAYQRRLAAAARLTGPERYLTYGQLDLDLTRDAAPLLAFDNLTEHDFYSARIGCQTFGIYGMDLAALCMAPAPLRSKASHPMASAADGQRRGASAPSPLPKDESHERSSTMRRHERSAHLNDSLNRVRACKVTSSNSLEAEVRPDPGLASGKDENERRRSAAPCLDAAALRVAGRAATSHRRRRTAAPRGKQSAIAAPLRPTHKRGERRGALLLIDRRAAVDRRSPDRAAFVPMGVSVSARGTAALVTSRTGAPRMDHRCSRELPWIGCEVTNRTTNRLTRPRHAAARMARRSVAGHRSSSTVTPLIGSTASLSTQPADTGPSTVHGEARKCAAHRTVFGAAMTLWVGCGTIPRRMANTSQTLVASIQARRTTKTMRPTTSDQCEVAAIWSGALTRRTKANPMPIQPIKRPRAGEASCATAMAATKAAAVKFARCVAPTPTS
jgi:peptide/nickel transport system substrate-binding protein